MFALLPIQAITAQQVVWATSAPIAKAYAQKSGKPMMVVTRSLDGGRNPLVRCFENQSVVELSRKFVCYRLAAPDEIASFGKVPKMFSDLMPAVFFLDSEGTFLSRMGAFAWPSAFAEYQRQALWIKQSVPALRSEMAKGQPSGDALAQWAVVKALQCDLRASATLCARAEKAGAKASLLSAAFLSLGDHFRAEGKVRESIRPLARSLEFANSPSEVFRARVRIASAYLRMGELDRAESEALRCIRMDGISKEDREIAELQLERIKFMRPPKA